MMRLSRNTHRLGCRSRWFALGLLFLLGTGTLFAAARPAPLPGADKADIVVDWPAFLGRLDPVWSRLPREWHDAPFLGNGMMGTLIRQVGDRQVRWDVGRGDVQDHRPDVDSPIRHQELYNRGRLPIGHFLLHTEGAIRGGEMRLKLWNAEATGSIRTDRGVIRWRTLVHAEDMVFRVELWPDEDERDFRLDFVPEYAESTRYRQRRLRRLPVPEEHAPNPAHALVDAPGGIRICEQPLAAGGVTATAWRIDREGLNRTLWVSVAHSHPGEDAVERARSAVETARNRDRAEWIAAHRRWWHAYYPASFVSFPDLYWESFYWIQIYKLACATRADRALLDNPGPWLEPTIWNGCWWNLNVQLAYSPLYAANRLHLGESLVRHFRTHLGQLIENVEEPYRLDSAAIARSTGQDLGGRAGRPGGREGLPRDMGAETGNLTWVCHNLDLHYRHTGDETLLETLLYPLLKRSVNYYRHFLFEGRDGRLHLPETHSPEYGNTVDACYDLALLRWGCGRLIELARIQELDEPLVPAWREILEKLTPFPEGEDGFHVGRGLAFGRSHRYWSHLLMIYPLHLVTPDDETGRARIERSLNHWLSHPRYLSGQSYTGAAAMAALLGDGTRALDLLSKIVPHLHASTLYAESGGPVLKTPLHGACVIQEMLLQSWGNRIRIFPALPEAWPEVTIHRLLARGNHQVSAVRREGKTQWVQVRSLSGSPCRIVADLGEDPRIVTSPDSTVRQVAPGRFTADLKKGRSLLIVRKGYDGDLMAAPVSDRKGVNPFGLKK